MNDFIDEWNLIQIDCKPICQCSLLTNVFQPNKVAKDSLGIDEIEEIDEVEKSARVIRTRL